MSHTIEKEWTTKAGHNAYVLYVNNSHNCGYVAVPKDHPWHEDDYYKHYNIEVHGGLTFAGTITDIDESWLFGFDAAHLGDKTNMHGMEMLQEPGDTFKDVDYMANQCELLSRQIKEMKVEDE